MGPILHDKSVQKLILWSVLNFEMIRAHTRNGLRLGNYTTTTSTWTNHVEAPALALSENVR